MPSLLLVLPGPAYSVPCCSCAKPLRMIAVQTSFGADAAGDISRGFSPCRHMLCDEAVQISMLEVRHGNAQHLLRL